MIYITLNIHDLKECLSESTAYGKMKVRGVCNCSWRGIKGVVLGGLRGVSDTLA